VSDDLAARLALVSMPGLGPARLSWLLRAGTAPEVVAQLRAGRLPAEVGPAPPGVTAKLVGRWTDGLRAIDPATALADVVRAGVELIDPAHEHWPFTGDPDPPVVVFATGDAGLVSGRPVAAVVGTRRCTALGRRVAFELAADLAEAGVVVVSGLAIGIDAAAHAGALAASGAAIGLVATGLDVVYPRANRELWARVAERGLLMSEAPPGTRPERWRFPARNRLIAGLADVVVVVESHAEGGALLTAGEAADRGRQVLAVPGSIASPASAGSNQLLRDGCMPVCSAQDVLSALGCDHGRSPTGPTDRADLAGRSGRAEALSDQGQLRGDVAPAADDHRDTPLARMVLAEVRAGSCHIDQLVAASRATIPELLAEIGRLQVLGLVDFDSSTVSVPDRSL
jgi:DNA processing protein